MFNMIIRNYSGISMFSFGKLIILIHRFALYNIHKNGENHKRTITLQRIRLAFKYYVQAMIASHIIHVTSLI